MLVYGEATVAAVRTMNVSNREPSIEVEGGTEYLSIEQEDETVRLAELSLPAPLTDDGVTMCADVEVKLCNSGTAVLADSYTSWRDVGAADNELLRSPQFADRAHWKNSLVCHS